MSEIRLFLPPGLPHEDSTVFWVIPGENRQGKCTLAQLPLAGKVLIFLPATEVGEHRIEVPDATSKHIEKLLPHTLEDHLLCEIDTLKLAWQALNSSTLLVHTASCAYLDSWLVELSKLNIKPDGIWSESALLPTPNADEVLLAAGPHGCLLRQQDATSIPMPFSVSTMTGDLFPDATIRCLIAPSAEKNPTLLALLDQAEQAHHDWTLNAPQGVSFTAAQHGRGLNLQIDWTQWKPALVLASALLSLLFLADFVHWMQLKQKHSQITARFTQLLKEHAPGTPIVDPQLQLEALVNRNQASPNTTNLNHPIQILKSVTPILTAAGLPSPTRIEGKANLLELYFPISAMPNIPAAQLNQLGLATRLTQQGNDVQMSISRTQP